MKNTFIVVLVFCSFITKSQTVPAVSPPLPLYCLTSTGQQIPCGGTWVDYNPANGLTYDCNCVCIASWTQQSERCTPRPKTKNLIGSSPPGNAQEVLGITPETHSNVTLQGYYLGNPTFTKTSVDATESWIKENDIKQDVISKKLSIRRKAIPVTNKPITRNPSGNRRLDNRLDLDRLYFKNIRAQGAQRTDSKNQIAMNKLIIEEKQKNYEIALSQQNINVTSSNMIVSNMSENSLYDFTKSIAIPIALGTAVAFAAPAGILVTLAAGAVIGVSTKNIESAAKCLMVDLPSNNPCASAGDVMLNVNTYKEVTGDVVLGAAFTPILKPIVKYGLVGKTFGMDLRTKVATKTTDVATDFVTGKAAEEYKEQLQKSVKNKPDNRSSSEQIYYWKPAK
jgi:hypothetical protein